MSVPTVVWSVWAVFIAIMVVVSVVQVGKLVRRERAMRIWPHTVATVVGLATGASTSFVGSAGEGGLKKYFAVYRYQGSDERWYERRAERGTFAPTDIGAPLTVCVNPANPAEAFPVESLGKATLVGMFVVMAVFGVASFFFVRLLVG